MDVFQNMELFSELIQCGDNIYTWCYNADGSLLQSNCPEAGFLSGAFDLFGCKKKMLDYGSRHTKPVTLGTAIGMTWAAAFEKDGSALKRVRRDHGSRQVKMATNHPKNCRDRTR